MTLLEVVLSVMLLALVTASVTGAISSITGMETRNRQRLGAYELANRLMLQFLDDYEALPDKSLPLEYGPYLFYWDLEKSPMKMVINSKQESGGASLLGLDRYKFISVTVFAAEPAGDYTRRGEPLASISRVVDPALPRNPDSMDLVGKSPDKIRNMILDAIGGGQPPPTTATTPK